MLRRPLLPLTILLALAPLGVSAQDSAPRIETAAALEALDFMTGRWSVPPDAPEIRDNPALADMVVLQVEWTVGRNALQLREGVRRDGPDGAELDGLVYWDPAEERIEFVAVGGRGEGQGRLFVGELRPLADGRVERVYDVYYRTAADMPGQELGGHRRRYRDVYSAQGENGLSHTLEWWIGGEWQPFARGRYQLVRAGSEG